MLAVYVFPKDDEATLIGVGGSGIGVMVDSPNWPNLTKTSRTFKVTVHAPLECSDERPDMGVKVRLPYMLNDGNKTEVEENLTIDDWCVEQVTPRTSVRMEEYVLKK